MARIAVLEHYQTETDRATRTMKLSAGKSLVKQGRAEWIRRNTLLKLFPPGTFQLRRPLTESITVDISIDPAEVSGLKFQDPESAGMSHARSRAILIGMANSMFRGHA